MGPNETELNRILGTDEWDAPDIQSLEVSLDALDKVLGDLSQENPAQWSGEAAKQAANSFGHLQERYKAMKDALREVRLAVDRANVALRDARAEAADLPSATVPSWIRTAVKTAQKVGQTNIVIGGYSYVADKAVSLIEDGLGNKREERAHDILETLSSELEVENKRLARSEKIIRTAAEMESFEDTRGEGRKTPEPEIPPRPPRGPELPDIPDLPPRKDSEIPDCDIRPWPPHDWVPSPDPIGGPIIYDPPPPPSPVDPPRWDGPDETDLGGPTPILPPYTPWEPGPSVDSDSGGSLGGNGLGAGLLGGGGAAGAAALRWGTGAGGAGGAGGLGARGIGPMGGPGGVGGLLGGGGSAGATGAGGGVAGGRGMAAGLPGGGAGGAGGSGAGGAGASGSAAGARGGMVGGGGAPGGAGGSDKKGRRSGLAGHIAPKFEDDEDFIPQSDAARAGSRDEYL